MVFYLKKERLKNIGKREETLWQEADDNAGSRKSKGYEQAADALRQLKDYAVYVTKETEFENKLMEFLGKHGYVALKRRLKNNKVM